MPAIAERHRLPGNRIKRLVAGLPDAPQSGALDAFSFGLDLHSVPVGDLGTTTSPDLTLKLSDSPLLYASDLLLEVYLDEIAIGRFDFVVEDIPPESFPGVSTDGTLFFKEQKVGRPASQPAVRQPTSQAKPPSPAESLLAMLLPVLLPPARSDLSAEPLALPKPLYAFQGDGVRWLIEHDPAALLADEMGLGKTVQAIVALRRLFREGQTTQAMVVCPKAVMTSWQRHFREWAPEIETIMIGGSQSERHAQWRGFGARRAHVVIANFDAVVRDIASVVPTHLGVLVIDEMQNLKSPRTKRHQEMRRISADRRWGLTGTPLENKVEDLREIVRFLDPALLSAGESSAAKIKHAASTIMLRRKKDVLIDLPELQCRVEYVSLGPRQRSAYQQAETEGVAKLQHGTINITNVLSLITALKQICNGVEGESAKTEWVTDYMETVSADDGRADERALVFSQYVRSLEHLQGEMSQYRPHLYTGSLSQGARQIMVDDFQSDSTQSRMMLMSLRAGGVGITLTKANHVVHFDSWWNPAAMSQATARAHRIGQEKIVIETTLVAEDTVEERIQRILDGKRDLFDQVVDDLSTEGLPRVLTEREIFGLFGLQAPER